MKPTKLSSLQIQPEEQADINDIAEIFHKLNNFNKSVAPKPFSEYDPESIFPPPSQISVNNNDNESEKSKSNNFVNAWKRSSVIEVKEEISFGSKYQPNPKRVKKIEVEKVVTNPQNSFSLLREEQLSNKESILNIKQQSQLNAPVTNFKITDFFAIKKQAPKVQTREIDDYEIQQQQKPQLFPQKTQKIQSFTHIEDPKTKSLIQSLVQKNNKRRKIIEDLKEELNFLKARNEETQRTLNEAKQEEKKKLKIKILQTNKRKIQFDKFKSSMHTFLNQKRVHQCILPEIDSKLRNLEEYKKKYSQKKGTNKKEIHTDEESIGIIGQQRPYIQTSQQLPDKKNYINQWMAKLEKFKEKIETDENYYEKMFSVNKKIQQVCDDVLKNMQTNNFLKDYVPFAMEFPYSETKTRTEQLIEIHAFNTELLRPQILTLLRCRKSSEREKQINNLFKLSKKLHNSAGCYFFQTTLASQMGENNEFLVYGRQKNEDHEKLTDVLLKYDSFSQAMIRYITRVCLIALEDIKIKADIPLFILPANIYFTPKYDIKFSNILMNTLFMHEQFRPYLKEQKFYYFVAPEALSQKDYSNLAVWSLGILLYFIIYQKYPFEYDFESSFLKETFFIYNELVFPAKPVVNEKLKDFIMVCLTGKQKDLSQLQKHPFFHK